MTRLYLIPIGATLLPVCRNRCGSCQEKVEKIKPSHNVSYWKLKILGNVNTERTPIAVDQCGTGTGRCRVTCPVSIANADLQRELISFLDKLIEDS